MSLRRTLLTSCFALGLCVTSVGGLAASSKASPEDAGVFVRDVEGHQVYCLKSHPNICRQGQWLLLTANAGTALFVNERLNKGRHVAWLLAMPNAKSKDKAKSTVAAYQFDCINQEWMTISVAEYDGPWGKGKVLAKSKKKSEPQLVEPGTPQETLMQAVCPAP